MADVGEMYLVHTMLRREWLCGRCFSNGPRRRRRRSWPYGGTTSGHRGCARRSGPSAGDWCRSRDAEEFATALDDLVRVLTEHTALEEKAVLPVAEKSG